jgi:hypothetical protein
LLQPAAAVEIGLETKGGSGTQQEHTQTASFDKLREGYISNGKLFGWKGKVFWFKRKAVLG